MAAATMEHGCEQPTDTTLDPSMSWQLAEPPLLPQIAAGDTSAVDRFVDRYSGLIWSIARRMTRSMHDAEDAVQEIFLELWKSAGAYCADRGSEVTFVAIISRRKLVDRIRQQATTAQVTELDVSMPLSQLSAGQEAVDVADEVTKVRHCFELLTHNTRTVLQLILHDGLSHQEVSKWLSMPLGSVKSFARRGLLTLRDCVSRPRSASLQEAQA